MFGSPIFLLYLLSFSVGVALATPLISREGLRDGYYSFMVGVSLFFGGLALAALMAGRNQLLIAGDPGGTVPTAWIAGIALYLAALVGRYLFMYSEKKTLREVFLWAALILGTLCLLVLAKNLCLFAGRGLAFQLDAILSAGLLGSMTHALILGHWYLVTPKLTLAPLIRMNRATLFFLYARCCWILGALIVLWSADPVAGRSLALNLFSGYGFLLFARVALGLVLPLVLHHMTEVPLAYQQTQPATGLLYISSIFMVGTELAAWAITIQTGVPA